MTDGLRSGQGENDFLRTQLQETGRCPVGGLRLDEVLYLVSDLGLNEWEVVIAVDGCLEVIEHG